MDRHSAQPIQPQTSLEGELLPCAVTQIKLSKQEYIQLKWDANFWHAQHKRACEREDALKQALQQKEAIIRDLNQRLFGKKSENVLKKTVTAPQRPALSPHLPPLKSLPGVLTAYPYGSRFCWVNSSMPSPSTAFCRT